MSQKVRVLEVREGGGYYVLGSVVHRPFQKGQAVSGVDGFVHVRLGHSLFLGPLCITISLPNKARSGH